MFSSGFAETSDTTVGVAGDTHSDIDDGASESASFSSSKWTRHFEDSDDEDDEMSVDSADDKPFESVSVSQTAQSSGSLARRDSTGSLESPAKDNSEDSATVGSDNETEGRNVRPKLSHPSSPGNSTLAFDRHEPEWQHVSRSDPLHGPNKLHVVIKDVAYTTYRAVLYYVCVVASSTSDHISINYIIVDLHGHHHLCTSLFVFLFVSTSFKFFICLFTHADALGGPEQQQCCKDHAAR